MSILFVFGSFLLCGLLAALVLVYVAFPQRGEELPARLRWLGHAMERGRAQLPVLSEEESDRLVAARR